jgi:hypothetical protein
MEQLESAYLEQLMRETQGDIQAACAVSGLKRARLYQLLKKERQQKPSAQQGRSAPTGEKFDPSKS